MGGMGRGPGARPVGVRCDLGRGDGNELDAIKRVATTFDVIVSGRGLALALWRVGAIVGEEMLENLRARWYSYARRYGYDCTNFYRHSPSRGEYLCCGMSRSGDRQPGPDG